MRVPPFALNGPAVEREHDANVDASETLIDHEMSLPSGRASKRVRSRGLPRNRGMDRKCGIMTVAIRRLLVAGGAGERPVKAPSPALCVRSVLRLLELQEDARSMTDTVLDVAVGVRDHLNGRLLRGERQALVVPRDQTCE